MTGTVLTMFGTKTMWHHVCALFSACSTPSRSRKLWDLDYEFTNLCSYSCRYCSDTEHFVFIHCGPRTSLNPLKYVSHWGGITLSSPDIEQAVRGARSVMRHVEIVGAGAPHNSTDGSALELIFQSPILESVNVTNSSMHGVMIMAPKGGVNLEQVTFEKLFKRLKLF